VLFHQILIDMFLKNKKNTGFGLMEVVVGLGVILVLMLGLMVTVSLSFKMMEINSLNLRAAFLLEEGVEAVRIMRDMNWTDNIAALATGTPYYLVFESGEWKSTTTEIVTDGVFTRTITLGEVERDFEQDIIETGGAIDEGTKKLTVFVNWDFKSRAYVKSISTYITNMFNE